MTSAHDVLVTVDLYLIAHHFRNCLWKKSRCDFGTTTELQLVAAINEAVLTQKPKQWLMDAWKRI